jgi:N-acetylglucosamine-6-sulfatase
MAQRTIRWSARLLIPLVVVVAVALVVASVVITRLGRSSPDEERFPRGRNTAEPAEIVPSASPAPPSAARPNVVMVLADDMRTDDLRWMPHVRSLLEDRGLSYANSFSPNPICAPARASLLTGQYSQNNGVFSVDEDNGFGALDDRRTLATSLNGAGYNTLFLGKYVNGYGEQDSRVTGRPSLRYVPPGWTDWQALVSRAPGSGYTTGGTYNYYNALYNVNGRIDQSHLGEYQLTSQARIADRMVTRYHRSAKPFFLYYAPIAPHFGSPREKDDPRITRPDGTREKIKTPARPRRVRGEFDQRIRRASGLPRDGGPSEADVTDKPRPMRYATELSPVERAAVRTLTRERAETLSVLDSTVAGLVASLKRTGEYDDTVIVFTSDNGYFLGEHRMRQGKLKPHEPSLRVPFLVAGDGVPHGRRYDPVTTEDVTATILDLAGARPPHPADGVSLVPTFTRDRGWTAPVLTEGRDDAGVFRVPRDRRTAGFDDVRTSIGIRTARWKYVRYDDGDGELYDLDRDPNELRSHFGEPAYAAVQARLQAVWLRYKDCQGAACSAPMPPDLQRTAARTRTATLAQERGVQQRYGYRR